MIRALPALAGALCALPGLVAPGFGQEDLASERPPGDGPTRIEVACYVVDIMRIIDTDGTFEADVFMLARWNDTRLSGEHVRVLPVHEVWTPNLLVFNQRDVSSDLPDVVEIAPDGTVNYRRRLIGTFASRFDLRRFPLDSQTLEIRLVLYGARADEVVLVESTSLPPAARSRELAITDWEIGEAQSSTGVFEPLPAVALSSFGVRFGARRLVDYYVVQLLIPLVLIVAMSWVGFWVDPSVVPTRMSVCVTTVLTLIAYRFMIGGLVPKLPYLTLMDHLLLGATVLVAGSLATIAAGAYLVRQNRKPAVERLDRAGRIVFPAGFVVLLASLGLFG